MRAGLTAATSICLSVFASAQTPTSDILIENGRIVDENRQPVVPRRRRRARQHQPVWFDTAVNLRPSEASD